MSTAVLETLTTAGPIAKVLKTEVARIHAQQLQGNQQQQTHQMRRKHNRNASNSRDASNSRREATAKTSSTYEF
jgi:hypothetical protein